MKNLIERIEQMCEATYSVDAEYRKKAIVFIEKLSSLIEKSPSLLIKNGDGFYVHASVFWDEPYAKNLYVFFAPKGAKGSNVKAGIGKMRGSDVLFLPLMSKAGDMDGLATRVSFHSSVIVHELTHLMDKGYERGKSVDPVIGKSYYNHPSEWNAFWSEGAYNVERMVSVNSERPRSFWEKIIGVTFDGFYSKRGMYWDKGFLEGMNKETKRKFDKRIYQLWLEISKGIPEK
jgi:hypothetical protein